MTRETKLGLVVGGAFILCFSLILSHAEDGQAVESELDTLALTSQAPPGFGQPAGSTQISLHDLLDAAQPGPRDGREKARPPASIVSDGVSSDIGPFNLPSGQKADAPAGRMAESVTRQSLSPDTPSSPSQVADAIRNRPLPASGPSEFFQSQMAPPVSQPQVQSFAVPVNAESRPPSSAPARGLPAAAPSASAEPAEVLKTQDVQIYVVGQGDSLSRIARKYYGSSERRAVQRIYEANRRTLQDINALRPGQELLIPGVDRPGKATTRKNVRWYKVQPKDRYSTIAQAELGNSKRWKEIRDLNLDIFPDPDLIRPGVRIRLPAK